MTIEILQECPTNWNNFLRNHELGTIYHTKEFSEYVRKWVGWKPLFFRINDGKGNILLQNLMFEVYPRSNKIPHSLSNLVKKFRSRLRWYYGPVSYNVDALQEFFHYLQNFKRFHGNLHPLSQANQFEYPFSKTQWSTFLINLRKTKEKLYNNLAKHSARKNIERALERNVVVEEITDKSWEEYILLLDSFRKSLGRDGANIENGMDFWRMLKKAGFTGFIAKKDGIPIGGLTFSFFNEYINEWGVARSECDKVEKLYSQDLIKWKIIEWGINNKMKWYDLSGVNPHPQSKKEEGILQYKKKWGGTQYYYLILGK